MRPNASKPSILIVAIILSHGLTYASQFLRPNVSTPYKDQVCTHVVGDPPCQTTLTTTAKRGFPFPYKTLVYETSAKAPDPNTAKRISQSSSFNISAFGWSFMLWFGFILLSATWWRKHMTINILKDPTVIALSALSAFLLITYQVAGADNSSVALVRDFINIFQYSLLVLLSYLLIRPLLQWWIAKSATPQARVGKALSGVFLAMLIAAAFIVVVFSLLVSMIL